MATEIVLPQWGMEMQDGTIVRWLKKEGDPVREGEPIVEVETAKIQTELESTATGILAHILAPEGAIVPIRAALAIIAAPGENVPRPAAVRSSPTPPAPASQRVSSSPTGRTGGPAAPTAAPRQVGAAAQVVPAARRLAQQHEIDLSRIQGSGPGGRILIADVERAIQTPARPPAQVIAMEGIRRTIATRLLQSLQTMAQVTLTTEANVAQAETLRAGLSRQWPGQGLSPLHLVIKAAARALKEHPRLNAIQGPEQVQLMDQVNIGIAVSLPEGLITPVIRDADAKSLSELASIARELAAKTREGKAKPEDVTGGTFTITNLGAYDIDAFTPIINPPQVAILGVGRVVEKPIVDQGAVTKGSMMFLSLTFDHRVVDGAPAAQFLQAVKQRLEDPWWMVA
jgi:pyruvate dehydrogenase E2 component (dihydrolipoamide acetyltransferase)